jgi:hypothetical protein
MGDRFYNEGSLVRYLLGQLSEEEQVRIEEEYFGNQEWFTQLEVVEGELIDAYVCHQLSKKDRQAFEKAFLSVPERRQRIAFAQALQVFVEQRKKTEATNGKLSFYRTFLQFIRSQKLGFVPVAVALLLLLGCIWLIFDNVRMRNRLQQVQAGASEIEQKDKERNVQLQRERENNALLAQELENAKNQISQQLPLTTKQDISDLKKQLQQVQINARESEKRNQELQEQLKRERERNTLLAKAISANSEIILNKQDASMGTNFTSKMLGMDSLILNSDAVRSSGGIPTLSIRKNEKTFALIMRVKNDPYKKFSAEIRLPGRTEILQASDLQFMPQILTIMPSKIPTAAATTVLFWILPVDSLKEGDYILTLKGTEESGEIVDLDRYPFRIIKK